MSDQDFAQALALHQQKYYDKAIVCYKTIHSRTESDLQRLTVARHIAIAYYEQKQFSSALTWLESSGYKPQLYESDTKEVSFLAFQCLLNLSQYHEAERLLLDAVQKGYDKVKYFYWRAELELARGNSRRAQEFHQLLVGTPASIPQHTIETQYNRIIHQLEASKRQALGVDNSLNHKLRGLKAAKTSTSKLYKKAVGYARTNQWQNADHVYTELLKSAPHHPIFLCELALVRYHLDCWDEAIKLSEEALKLAPNDATVLNNAGYLYRIRGSHERALSCFQDAVRLQPKMLEASLNVGACLINLKRYDEALSVLTDLQKQGIDNSDLKNNIAICHLHLGDYSQCRDNALASIRANPQHHNSYITLSSLCVLERDIDSAISCIQDALKDIPSNPYLLVNLGDLYARNQDYNEAIRCADLATSQAPLNIIILKASSIVYTTAGVFHRSYDLLSKYMASIPSDKEVYATYASCCANLAFTSEALEFYEKALCHSPTSLGIWSQFLFHLLYQDLSSPTEYSEQAKKLSSIISKNSETVANTFTLLASPRYEENLRIGFISGDLRTHSIAYFLIPLLEGLQSLGVATYAYSTYTQNCEIQESLISLFAYWRDVEQLDDYSAAKLINTDNLDLLIDLSGHTAHNRLAVLLYRPCIHIAHYLGYMGTIGIPSISSFVSDCYLHTEIDESLYTEKIVRLARPYLSYKPPAELPCIQKSLQSGFEDRTVYGSFNNALKYTPQSIRLWSQILKEDPNAIFLMKSRPLREVSVRNKIASLFDSNGISSDRLVFANYSASQQEHLSLYNNIHCSLDSVGFTGGTTTCESLWMGVPVVTLCGQTMKSRISTSILKAADQSHLITTTIEHYIATALETADRIRSNHLAKSDLRERLVHSPLSDGTSLAHAFLAAFNLQ